MKNNMWQKCPICNGTGRVTDTIYTTNSFTKCNVCNSKGIISTLTGLPPTGIEVRPLAKDSGDFRDNCEQFSDK